LAGIFIILSLDIAVGVPLIRAGINLLQAREALTLEAADVVRSDLIGAKQDLDTAVDSLESLPVRALAGLPGPGHNYAALTKVARASSNVLARALDLQDWRDENLEDVFAEGRIDFDVLDTVAEPLVAQTQAFGELETAAAGDRSPWLLPPLWDALDELEERAGELHSGTERAAALLEHSRSLLGDPDPRTYLVMSINNAELRGAGGLLSGIGTVTFDRGDIDVGRQWPREYYQRKPYRKVPAPAAYLQRYGTFKANTTLWANVTYSPDLVDSALVATRLFESQTGIHTEGALIVDPRGLEALIPSGTEIPVTGADEPLHSEAFARWIYSDAYTQFDDDFERRAAIIEVGSQALDSALEGGLQIDSLPELGAAVAGGHIALISFDSEELAALEDLGLASTVGEIEDDYLMVAAHNFGDGHGEGTKLDYWVKRSVRHGCAIDGVGVARCAAEAAFDNQAPEGLTAYVAGARPYGLLRSFVEILIPRDAELTGVYVNAQPTEYRRYVEGEVQSIAVYIRVPRQEQQAIIIEYELPARNEYSFTLRPQPLTEDARVKLLLRVPDDWSVTGPPELENNVHVFDGALTGPLHVEARPDARLGLSAAWDGVRDLVGKVFD